LPSLFFGHWFYKLFIIAFAIRKYFPISIAKPIDLLAKYISAEGEVDAVEMHEPYTYLNGLTIKDLEDLIEDIKVKISQGFSGCVGEFVFSISGVQLKVSYIQLHNSFNCHMCSLAITQPCAINFLFFVIIIVFICLKFI
jgi:hypothetical protein